MAARDSGGRSRRPRCRPRPRGSAPGAPAGGDGTSGQPAAGHRSPGHPELGDADLAVGGEAGDPHQHGLALGVAEAHVGAARLDDGLRGHRLAPRRERGAGALVGDVDRRAPPARGAGDGEGVQRVHAGQGHVDPDARLEPGDLGAHLVGLGVPGGGGLAVEDVGGLAVVLDPVAVGIEGHRAVSFSATGAATVVGAGLEPNSRWPRRSARTAPPPRPAPPPRAR